MGLFSEMTITEAKNIAFEDFFARIFINFSFHFISFHFISFHFFWLKRVLD
jgi:hypothetical protein